MQDGIENLLTNAHHARIQTPFLIFFRDGRRPAIIQYAGHNSPTNPFELIAAIVISPISDSRQLL